MNSVANVLFDLDGTLTDPADGITRCLSYALEKLGMPSPPREDLVKYIGPPLRQNFIELCGTSDSDVIEQAVVFYRERFVGAGMYENQVYDGVVEMLDSLRDSFQLFVATSKVTEYSQKILEHFSLAEYFVEVRGSEPDGRTDDKALLIAALIERHGLDTDATVMVGDRRQDIVAATRNGVLSIGVSYGYGSREELTEAGATWICASPDEVAERILPHM